MKEELEKEIDFSTQNSLEISKEHAWLFILKEMKERGIADSFRFVYDGKVYDKLRKFSYDYEKGGIGVEKPDKVLLVKKKRVGYLEKEEVVGEIDFRRFVDPTPEESLKILDLIKDIE